MKIDREKKERIQKIVSYFSAIFSHELDIANFSDRIRLQKMMYLLKTMGIDLHYSFGWHVRGPYAFGLVDDGYDYLENKDKMDFSYTISSEEEKIIDKVKQISSYLKDPENSELLASYLFIRDGLQFGERARDELRIRKPRFSDKEVETALQLWDTVMK